MKTLSEFRSMPPRRQFGVALVAMLLIGVLLVAFYVIVLRADYRPLFTDLKTADAATIVAELDRTKTPYKLENGGATILVPADRVDAARLEVMGADLPLKGVVGFEIFNESDMGLTEFAQRINYQRALQGELARTIMTLDSVDTARLHLTLGERALFREQRTPPKASVTVLPRAGMRIAPATVAGIQRLVAAAVPDLDVANVVVIDAAGRVISADTAPEPAAIEPLPGTALENHYVAKISQAIEATYPGSRARVTVSAGPGAPADPGMTDPSVPRAFALRVDVAFPTAQPDPIAADIREIVGDAIGGPKVAGDIVTISVIPLPRIADAPPMLPDVGQMPPRATAAVTSSSWPATGWLLALALLAILVIVALLRRRSDPPPMTPDERVAYAERLRALLGKGGADVRERG